MMALLKWESFFSENKCGTRSWTLPLQMKSSNWTPTDNSYCKCYDKSLNILSQLPCFPASYVSDNIFLFCDVSHDLGLVRVIVVGWGGVGGGGGGNFSILQRRYFFTGIGTSNIKIRRSLDLERRSFFWNTAQSDHFYACVGIQCIHMVQSCFMGTCANHRTAQGGSIWLNSRGAWLQQNTRKCESCAELMGNVNGLNILRPKPNGRSFADDSFKWIFLNENVWISLKISLKFVPKGPINNIPVLVWITAWRRPGAKPLSEPMMVNLLTHIYTYMRHSVLISAEIHPSRFLPLPFCPSLRGCLCAQFYILLSLLWNIIDGILFSYTKEQRPVNLTSNLS